MWGLIVSVSDHCLSFCFAESFILSSSVVLVGGEGFGATTHSYLCATKLNSFILLSNTTLSSFSLVECTLIFIFAK